MRVSVAKYVSVFWFALHWDYSQFASQQFQCESLYRLQNPDNTYFCAAYLDRNGDGMISPAELKSALKEAEIEISECQLKELMQETLHQDAGNPVLSEELFVVLTSCQRSWQSPCASKTFSIATTVPHLS